MRAKYPWAANPIWRFGATPNLYYYLLCCNYYNYSLVWFMRELWVQAGVRHCSFINLLSSKFSLQKSFHGFFAVQHNEEYDFF